MEESTYFTAWMKVSLTCLEVEVASMGRSDSKISLAAKVVVESVSDETCVGVDCDGEKEIVFLQHSETDEVMDWQLGYGDESEEVEDEDVNW
eukprot:s2941_g15.t1